MIMTSISSAASLFFAQSVGGMRRWGESCTIYKNVFECTRFILFLYCCCCCDDFDDDDDELLDDDEDDEEDEDDDVLDLVDDEDCSAFPGS